MDPSEVGPQHLEVFRNPEVLAVRALDKDLLLVMLSSHMQVHPFLSCGTGFRQVAVDFGIAEVTDHL